MKASQASFFPDQTGRLVVVTGANSGIGFCVAREFARNGARVVLACRDLERGAAALRRLNEEVTNARAELVRVDLADQRSIHDCAGAWRHGPIDILINNAGIAMVPFARTRDGFESQFGVNHLGTFALSGLLLPHLLAARAPRVVTVSSEGQRFARFDLDNLNAERSFHTFWAYLQSKRANLYFAAQLQALADAAHSSLRSMVVAPGLTRTNVLTGGANERRGRLYHALVGGLISLLFRPTLEGAKTTLWAATQPDLPGGSYVVPDGFLQLRGTPTLRPQDASLRHRDAMRELWRRSEALTGVRFAIARSVPD
ncbi:MAG TPA: SDR family NAD(P)-dependent oxidoreductase [Polyangiales bacterium]